MKWTRCDFVIPKLSTFMYMPEDVQFWLDKFCHSLKEIFTACEENNDCNSSQSDTETETLENVAKKSFHTFSLKIVKVSICPLLVPPKPCFLSLKKVKVPRILQLSLSVTCSSPQAIAEVSNPKRWGVGD